MSIKKTVREAVRERVSAGEGQQRIFVEGIVDDHEVFVENGPGGKGYKWSLCRVTGIGFLVYNAEARSAGQLGRKVQRAINAEWRNRTRPVFMDDGDGGANDPTYQHSVSSFDKQLL